MQSHRELRLDFKNTANIRENDVSYDSGPLGGNLLWFLKTTGHSWRGQWRWKVFTTPPHPCQSGVFPVYLPRPSLEAFACLSFRRPEDYLYFSLRTVMWLNGSLGDEGWLAFVNTHCRHLERGSCWKLTVELRWPHQPQAVSPLHPGEARGSGRLPKLFHATQSWPAASQGMQRWPSKMQRPSKQAVDSSWDQPSSPKVSAPVCLFWVTLQPTLESSLGNLLLPNAQVRSPGIKVGFVWGTSKTTRRCEQMLHQLFLSFIFTGKPKTKHHVAKNRHRAI